MLELHAAGPCPMASACRCLPCERPDHDAGCRVSLRVPAHGDEDSDPGLRPLAVQVGLTMALGSRLKALERLTAALNAQVKGRLVVFWPDELEPCPVHRGCDIEKATGKHHVNVIHLGWATDS